MHIVGLAIVPEKLFSEIFTPAVRGLRHSCVFFFENRNRGETIDGRSTHEDEIALTGPAVNVVLGFSFSTLWMVTPDDLISSLFFFIAYINIYLAVFNLIPFGPLDGLKVFRWKKTVWALLFGIGIVVMLYLLGVFL